MNRSPIGLYRHFKGGYYFVQNVVRDTKTERPTLLYYFDVLHPESGFFVRDITEFYDFVGDRKDNVTGQSNRFERVTSLENYIENFSTEQLIKELQSRKDSPFQTLDIEGLNSLVFSHDFAIGEPYEETRDTPRGVETLAVCDSPEEAFDYLKRNANPRASVFKRVFIKQEE